MSRKLLLFGGLSVASIATITPTGIHFQKEAQKRKERQDFINASNDAVDSLNAHSQDKKNGEIKFLKYVDEDDKWKLMWIVDIWNYYKKEEIRKTIKNPLDYTKEEMQQFENAYWENRVLQRQGKWNKQMTDQWLKQVNSKPKYWEKFKEMCLILIANGKIDKNNDMDETSDSGSRLLCNWWSIHDEQWEKYKIDNPKLGIMEHFWTVKIKPSGNN